MDRNGKTKPNQSILVTAKNFGFAGIVVLLIALFLGTSCQSSPQPVVNPPPQDYLLMKGARQITYLGENESPIFSPQGDRILFISRNRVAHKNPQLYEFHILRNSERRITFQDGEVRHPRYISENRILYSSSTDEIKENLADFFNATTTVLDLPPMEIYESDLYGNDIVRVTHSSGYDAEAIYVRNGRPFLLFTSYRNGFLGLYKFDYKQKSINPWAAEKGKERYSPTLSSDQKTVAWLERSTKDKKTSIVVSPLRDFKPKVLKDFDENLRDLHFVEGKPQLLYSIQRDKHPAYIEVYDFEKNCTQVVFSGQDSLIQPQYSAGSPPHIVFTRVLPQTKQIYLVDWPKDLGPCLESKQ